MSVQRCPVSGKVRFRYWEDAMLRVVEIMRDPDRTERVPQRVHSRRCRHCRGWHLTSMDHKQR